MEHDCERVGSSQKNAKRTLYSVQRENNQGGGFVATVVKETKNKIIYEKTKQIQN
jgi:hypothetical protein